jgi:hypothetical protein
MLSALPDPSRRPTESELAAVLVRAAPVWTTFVADVQAAHGPLEEQWNHGGAKIGWTMRLRRPKRAVAYLIPGEGRFLVGLVLPRKAVAALATAKLPKAMTALVEAAPTYAEGRGVRIPCRTAADAAALVRLVALREA